MTWATTEVSDELSIKYLLFKERYNRDTNQWQKLRNSYHPNPSKTHIEITWFQGDVDGFVNGSQSMTSRGTGTVHTICPIEVHLMGDKAVTGSTGSISIPFSYEGQQYDCNSFTRFISRLQKVDGKWNLLMLEAIYDRDSIASVLPSAQVDCRIPLGSRESYKCSAWLLGQKGFNIKQDLPAVDVLLLVII
ncbi:hypothetical protein BDV27DRAFT_140330 [Aspergillus caelatus]|uniref:SnoaL-like domain-containing protein n=1 Tax=Aspergillus caelatus TaxID=61420 RepID=A0A5N7APU1_9EURO|nr:uncharacterized protein BDV27DRAFT_140330 [Aspergillus caelatus]KAE8370740.1 hypothetical protein BDV27DRAFT_140330 [Aspergillus caelatus]